MLMLFIMIMDYKMYFIFLIIIVGWVRLVLKIMKDEKWNCIDLCCI